MDKITVSFTLDRGCYERGCVAYDERDGDGVNISAERVDETVKGGHEPVCFLRETNWSYEIAPWNDKSGFPVYTAPLKREWVGMTDEEVKTIVNDNTSNSNGFEIWCNGAGVARAIEAKLKEKNT